MTHRGPFQPLPFCDSVKIISVSYTQINLKPSEDKKTDMALNQKNIPVPKNFAGRR